MEGTKTDKSQTTLWKTFGHQNGKLLDTKTSFPRTPKPTFWGPQKRADGRTAQDRGSRDPRCQEGPGRGGRHRPGLRATIQRAGVTAAQRAARRATLASTSPWWPPPGIPLGGAWAVVFLRFSDCDFFTRSGGRPQSLNRAPKV